jgi:hypothetical protein
MVADGLRCCCLVALAGSLGYCNVVMDMLKHARQAAVLYLGVWQHGCPLKRMVSTEHSQALCVSVLCLP